MIWATCAAKGLPFRGTVTALRGVQPQTGRRGALPAPRWRQHAAALQDSIYHRARPDFRIGMIRPEAMLASLSPNPSFREVLSRGGLQPTAIIGELCGLASPCQTSLSG